MSLLAKEPRKVLLSALFLLFFLVALSAGFWPEAPLAPLLGVRGVLAGPPTHDVWGNALEAVSTLPAVLGELKAGFVSISTGSKNRENG